MPSLLSERRSGAPKGTVHRKVPERPSAALAADHLEAQLKRMEGLASSTFNRWTESDCRAVKALLDFYAKHWA